MLLQYLNREKGANVATELGRFLRKLRIDNDELLKDMASKLDVSPSMLSAIENGTRKATKALIEKVSKTYTLALDQIQELEMAVAKTTEQVSIALSNANESDKELAVSFARSFDNLDEASKKRIREILNSNAMDE